MAKSSRKKSKRTSKRRPTRRPPRKKKRPKRKKKECLVISVIGKKGTPERQHADLILDDVISPALTPLAYEVYRIDKIRLGTRIDEKLVTKLMEADLVVADVTYANPNVYWELGARRAWNLPVVQMARDGTSLPFDIGSVETLYYGDLKLVKAWKKAKADLKRFVRQIESGDSKVTLFDNAFRRLGFSWSKENREAVLRWLRSILKDYHVGTVNAMREVREEFDPSAQDAIRALASIVNKPIIKLQDQWHVLAGISGEIVPREIPAQLDNLFAAIKQLLDDAVELSMHLMEWAPSKTTLSRVRTRLSGLAKTAKAIAAMKPREKKS